jgi:hypothetical protein
LEFLTKAAKKLGDISIGEFARRASLEAAERILGEKAPVCPPFTKGRKTAASQVATKLGVDRRTWERAVIDAAAKHALQSLEDDSGPKRKSDIGGLVPPAPVRRRSKTG